MTKEVKPETEEVKPEGTTRDTTLGELGLSLPIFTEGNDNDPARAFSFKEWDMDTEEAISDMQNNCENVGEFVRKMMDLLLDEFCGKSWESLSADIKLLTLTQLHFPNMLYMFIALRVEELGHDLKFETIPCPNCGKIIKNFVADLRGLDVKCKDKGHELENRYDLVRPITMKDGKLVTGLKLHVTKWQALESLSQEDANNTVALKKAIFKNSITGAYNNDELHQFVDSQELVRKIKKIDQVKVGNAIAKNNAGVEMAVGGKCPHCRNEFEKIIDWGYEVFFDSSSL